MADSVEVPEAARGSGDPVTSGDRAASAVLGAPQGTYARVRDGFRAYRMIAGMWIRSTMAYRASFVMTTFGNFAATALDFVAVLLMFSRVDRIGGYSLPEVAFLYGVSATSFGITDLVVGSMDRLGRRVRDGTLDTLLVRPVPVLAQVAADRFALRRLGRVTQGLLVLAYAIAVLDIDWTPLRLLMVPLMLLCGAAIFAAVFVAAWSLPVHRAGRLRGAELLHVRRHHAPAVPADRLRQGPGARGHLRAPAGLRELAARAVRAGRPYPLDLPTWIAFTPPLIAAGCCALAGIAWRAGLRSYRSTGS